MRPENTKRAKPTRRRASSRWGLAAILVVYLLFGLGLLTKDLAVFPDEASFATTAYWLVDKARVGELPFQNPLTLIEKTTLTQYGPVYYLVLGPWVKFFGFQAATVRLFSLLVGLGVLVTFYRLLKDAFGQSPLALLITALLAADLSFLRTARLGRMEILVMFFGLIAYRQYFKILARPKGRDLFLLSLVLAAGLLTHFWGGAIALAVILAHILLTRKFSLLAGGRFLFFLAPVGAVVLWVAVAARLFPEAGTESGNFILSKIALNLYTLKTVLADRNTYLQANLTAYLALMALAAFLPKAGQNKAFWLLNAILTTVLVIWGNSYFYLGFLPVACLPLVGYILTAKPTGGTKIFTLAAVFGLAITGVSQEIILARHFTGYSYRELGEKVTACLPDAGKKVYFGKLVPDPYLYLAGRRPDLKIAYQRFHDEAKLIERAVLPETDYVITYAVFDQLIADKAFQKAVNDPALSTELDWVISSRYSLDPDMVRFLYEHKKESCLVSNSPFFPDLAVFRVK